MAKGVTTNVASSFPFVPIMTYFESLIESFELKLQGIVRPIIDSQKQYNRRHSQIIDIMESIIEPIPTDLGLWVLSVLLLIADISQQN